MSRCFRSAAVLALALAASSCLTSCLDGYDEEMVLNGDLSGNVLVKVRLPDAVTSGFTATRSEFDPAKIEKRFAGLDGVKLRRYSITEGRHPVATFEVSFSSLEKLGAAAAANPPAAFLVGTIRVRKTESGETEIERQLGEGGTAGLSLPADKNAMYRVHFPASVGLAYTNSGMKDDSHNDVRYHWSLAEVQAQKPQMVNRVALPLPWKLILQASGGLLALAWLGWLLTRRRDVVR